MFHCYRFFHRVDISRTNIYLYPQGLHQRCVSRAYLSFVVERNSRIRIFLDRFFIFLDYLCLLFHLFRLNRYNYRFLISLICCMALLWFLSAYMDLLLPINLRSYSPTRCKSVCTRSRGKDGLRIVSRVKENYYPSTNSMRTCLQVMLTRNYFSLNFTLLCISFYTNRVNPTLRRVVR